MEPNSRNFQNSILEYIIHEISSDNYQDECLEALEVARQCLETAWKIKTTNKSDKLLKMFYNTKDQHNSVILEVTEQEKKAAETLKCQGNVCMAENLYEDAVSCYTKAIEINGCNAVYYCNRAAAYSNLSKHENAIEDCDKAITIDPKYAKAYSRKGLAFAAMKKYEAAKECYKSSLKLDPTNKISQEKLRSVEEKLSRVAVVPEMSEPINNDLPSESDLQSLITSGKLSSFVTSPAFVELLPRLLRNPGCRDLLAQSMSAGIAYFLIISNLPNEDSNTLSGATGFPNANTFDNVAVMVQFWEELFASNADIVSGLNQIFGQVHDGNEAENMDNGYRLT